MPDKIKTLGESGLTLGNLDRFSEGIEAGVIDDRCRVLHGRNSTPVEETASTGVVANVQQLLYVAPMALGARLGKVLEDKQKSQAWLARETGIEEGTISALITRDSERSKFAPVFADALGISLHWLMTGEGDRDVRSFLVSEAQPPGDRSKYVMVRRLNAQLSAGSGSLVEHDELQDYVAFRRDWLQRKGIAAAHAVVAEVVGESMAPTLQDGDVVLVNVIDKEVRDGKIYAFRAHGEVRVKRFQRTATGGIVITSDNKSPQYRDEELSAAQLENLDMIGRVAWGAGDL